MGAGMTMSGDRLLQGKFTMTDGVEESDRERYGRYKGTRDGQEEKGENKYRSNGNQTPFKVSQTPIKGIQTLNKDQATIPGFDTESRRVGGGTSASQG